MSLLFPRSFPPVPRLALAVAGTLLATTAFAAPPAATADPAASIFRADTSLVTPLDDLRYESPGISTSADPLEGERANLSPEGFTGAGAGQPGYGQRRRSYGRSRYQDRMHNPDGSTRIAFVAGAGLSLPVGNTGKFYTPSYGIAVGAGLNFSKSFGILAEYHYDHFGLTGGAIDTEYNNLISIGATADQLSGFDANAHVHSLTVDPIVSFSQDRSPLGVYFTGGVGYYRKTTNFTLPQVGVACNSFYCEQVTSNVNIDSASANSFGLNGGFGLTYKLSQFSSERLFLEARYNWLKIDSGNNNDFFPYNRRNSEYIPIIAGIRF